MRSCLLKFPVLFLFFLFLFSATAEGREIKIQVAVTADVHGRFFSYDFVKNQPAGASLAHIHYLKQAMGRRQGSNLILLDNGDLIQGTPAAYYANFVQETDKNLIARVMNYVGFDAATVGNHDIEAGPEVYNRLKEEFDFPWLGANVLDEESGEPYFTPYTVIERERIRVAVLGLTTTGVPTWLPPHLWEGLVFEDMVESAAYWVDYIREHEQPDAIVGLFHSGFGSLNPDPDSHPLEHASGYVAKNVPGFDVIFAAHDHRRRVQTVTNVNGDPVLVLGPGHFAEHLAVAELTFEREARRTFTLKGVEGDMISTSRVVPHREFVRTFEDDVTDILRFANERVGELTLPMESIEALFGSAPFTDLAHEIQLSLTDAELSFTAPLAFNETIRQGPLHMRDFFRLYEYENYLYTMELSGSEILDYLEYSYGLWLNEMEDADDHLLNVHQDALGRVPDNRRGRGVLRNPPYNFDSAAGIRYTVDVSLPVGERVEIQGMENGGEFDPKAVYVVAINSYRGSGGGGHLTNGADIPHGELSDRIVSTTDKDLRSYMVEFFREQESYTPESRDNWLIIPDEWREKGREKTIPYLRNE